MWADWLTWPAAGRRGQQRLGHAIGLAAMVAGWMAGTWLVADSGVLGHWTRVPPPFMLLVIAIVALATRLAFSALGHRLATALPLWLLVGVQGFRVPLELAMHRLAERGVMPPQMSYGVSDGGLNFDIVTGISAIVVATLVAAGRAGRRVVLAWNVLGLALLVNVVVIAILSTPLVAAFGPDRLNVFVTHAPFVWLPAVMVLAAFAGHLIVFRALAAGRRG